MVFLVEKIEELLADLGAGWHRNWLGVGARFCEGRFLKREQILRIDTAEKGCEN